jgi:hypothetical protein
MAAARKSAPWNKFRTVMDIKADAAVIPEMM